MCVYVRVDRGHPAGVNSVLPSVGPRDHIQVVRFSSKGLYPLSHLADHVFKSQVSFSGQEHFQNGTGGGTSDRSSDGTGQSRHGPSSQVVLPELLQLACQEDY